MTTIVTLALDQTSQQRFEELRKEHYPPALNRIPAHLSLFHALPGDRSARHILETAAQETSIFPLRVDSLRSMGRGVLYHLSSPELLRLHAGLVASFRTFLIPQDRQPLKPHVVVQNKVEPQEAKSLLARLEQGFTPWMATGEALLWWEYLGGPWRLIERFSFAESKFPDNTLANS